MDYPDTDPALLALLPPILRAIVTALGFTRAQQWLSEVGGVPLRIPKRKKKWLGLELDEVARLAETLAPHLNAVNEFSCPMPDKLFLMARNAAINTNKHRESIRQQAWRYGLSSRQIINIRRTDDGGEQMDLFKDQAG